MLAEILAVVGYEVVTTAATVLGIKALSGGTIKRQMLGLKQPKRIPFVDAKMKRYVGSVSKMENRLSRHVVQAIHRMSEYDSFRFLLIVIGRKIREAQTNVETRAHCSGRNP